MFQQLTPETFGAIQALVFVGTPIAAGAAAFVALKMGLNGTKEDVKQTRMDVASIKQSLDGLKNGQHEARVERTIICSRLDDTSNRVTHLEKRLDRPTGIHAKL